MARRTVSLVPRWCSRVFSVELDGAAVYFAPREKHRGEDAPRLFGDARGGHARLYSLIVCGGDRITRAKFHGELRDKLLRELPPGCDVSPMSSFVPDVRDSLLKGYFLKDNSQGSSTTERLLRDMSQRDPVSVCSYLKCVEGQVWTQRLWSPPGSPEMSKDFYVVPSDAPECHPSTLNIINSDVFYSFEEAHDVIKQVVLQTD